MVSMRCTSIAKKALADLGYPNAVSGKGQIQLAKDLKAADRKTLTSLLKKSGMVLLDKEKSQLFEAIDLTLDELLHKTVAPSPDIIPQLIEKQVNESYQKLTHLIAEVKGISMDHYVLISRIEVVKEKLIYEDLNLSALAVKLGFKNRSTLAYQFKKVTGLSPTFYKVLRKKRFKEAI